MNTMTAYTADILNNLPSLGASEKTFLANNGGDLISNHLRNLFIEYGLVDKLGLCLLHKHFDLSNNEALVDTNGTSAPWNLADATPVDDGCFEKYGGLIQPRAWYLSSAQELVPYEFYFHHAGSNVDDCELSPLRHVTPDFMKDFSDVLEQSNLIHNIGLCLRMSPIKKQVETTEGRANITFSMPDDVDITGQGYVPAIWYYETIEGDLQNPHPIVRSTCVGSCFKAGDTHLDSHRSIPSPDSDTAS